MAYHAQITLAVAWCKGAQTEPIGHHTTHIFIIHYTLPALTSSHPALFLLSFLSRSPPSLLCSSHSPVLIFPPPNLSSSLFLSVHLSLHPLSSPPCVSLSHTPQSYFTQTFLSVSPQKLCFMNSLQLALKPFFRNPFYNRQQ